MSREGNGKRFGNRAESLLGYQPTHGITTETTSDGWIPVSKRLPEEDEEVLITLLHGTVTWAFLYLGQWNTMISVYLKDCVLAWMPLPEPWKESVDSGKDINVRSKDSEV